jgi:Transglycosylase SLT domain
MAVDSVAAGAASQIAGAIQQAARTTGVSFEYLLTTAKLESNLNPAAQAATSSAKGLYQFIDQTWLATMKATGAALGYGRYADAISKTPDGRYEVTDPTLRTAIMQLRNDPTTSAMLAGAFTRANASELSAAIGRAPTEGELYIAHFLGSDGAGKLISAAAMQPQANAAAMFPQAAEANQSIFYDRGGRARSASEVYAVLASRFETTRAAAFNAGQRGTGAAPDTAGVTAAFAAADQAAPLPDTRPLFQAMFTDRTQALTGTVNRLWTPAKPAEQPSAAPAQDAPPLDLFSDTGKDVRKLFGS